MRWNDKRQFAYHGRVNTNEGVFPYTASNKGSKESIESNHQQAEYSDCNNLFM